MKTPALLFLGLLSTGVLAQVDERELEAAVMRRELRIGMTPEQVARTWGNPTRQEVTEKAAGKTYTWFWRCADRSHPSNAVVFKDGRVASIRTSCI